jgi:hypothetical protein
MCKHSLLHTIMMLRHNWLILGKICHTERYCLTVSVRPSVGISCIFYSITCKIIFTREIKAATRITTIFLAFNTQLPIFSIRNKLAKDFSQTGNRTLVSRELRLI